MRWSTQNKFRFEKSLLLTFCMSRGLWLAGADSIAVASAAPTRENARLRLVLIPAHGKSGERAELSWTSAVPDGSDYEGEILRYRAAEARVWSANPSGEVGWNPKPIGLLELIPAKLLETVRIRCLARAVGACSGAREAG